MEEIFETLREQIKGDFDQNNIIIILDNSISLTYRKHPIPGTNNSIIIIQPYLIDILENIGKQSLNIFEYFHRVQIYLTPRYTKSIIRLSRTIRPIPIPRILNHLPRTRIQLQSPHKVQIPGPKNKRTTRTKPTNQEPNPIQPNK